MPTPPKMPQPKATAHDPVVASAHLARSAQPQLSEIEFGLTMASHAFHRWMTRCASAAGAPGLSPLEVQVIHLVHHRERAKTQAEICLVLNVEDTHLVSYAVKKLAAAGLVRTGREGKEKTVATTPEGAALCTRYGALREQLLVEAVRQLGYDGADLARLASLLRALSGSYDQAARSAAVF